MADTRTLKLSILADVDQLARSLKTADNDVQTFGDKLSKWSKVAGAAFAAAGAAAVAYGAVLLKDGVQSAIADAAAQEKLATSLRNTTKATDIQIAATEDYITQTTLATGVTDDELRPSLDRLARATGSVEKAQQLQKIALDASIGTGKSLDAVTQALAKAYEGNTTALGRLGVGIDKAELKSMSFDQITARLASTFKDQASVQAETFEGKMARLQVAFDEGKETVGAFVLDAITPMVTTFVNKVIPAISGVADGMGKNLGPVFESVGKYVANIFGPIWEGLKSAFDRVRDAIARNEDNLRPLWELMKAVGAFARDTLAPILGKTLGAAFDILGTAVSKIIDGFAWFIDKVRDAYNWVIKLKTAISNIDLNPFNNVSLVTSAPSITTLPNYTAPTPATDWSMTPVSYTVNLNSTIIDPEGAARAVSGVLSDSAARTGNYSTLGLAPIGLSAAF